MHEIHLGSQNSTSMLHALRCQPVSTRGVTGTWRNAWVWNGSRALFYCILIKRVRQSDVFLSIWRSSYIISGDQVILPDPPIPPNMCENTMYMWERWKGNGLSQCASSVLARGMPLFHIVDLASVVQHQSNRSDLLLGQSSSCSTAYRDAAELIFAGVNGKITLRNLPCITW